MPEPAEMRQEYRQEGLDETACDPDPVRQFGAWFQAAVDAGVPEANAMTLATADGEGRPAARILLLKGFDPRGFTFFTNYESRKAREIAVNPRGALVFHWGPLARQVRIEGRLERVSREESEAYFQSRPRGAQLGAWSSPQSAVLAGGRGELEERRRQVEERFGAGEEGPPLPLPEHWGGFRLVPRVLEFWQGRPDRLHDRLRYRRAPAGGWVLERLAP
jgi:pyridoxamine 5'-phosphate oxidase